MRKIAGERGSSTTNAAHKKNQTVKQLELAYTNIERVILKPWELTKHRPPGKYVVSWNGPPDKIVLQQSRLYQ